MSMARDVLLAKENFDDVINDKPNFIYGNLNIGKQ